MNDYSSITFFDRVTTIGSKILQVYGGLPASSETNKYLKLVEEVYKTLSQIHKNLIDVTINADLAQTMDEAKQILGRIQQMGLKDVLKAQNLCDKLGQLGHRSRELPQDKFGFTAEEKDTWDEFCCELEDREGGTARLYDLKLYDLRVLHDNETNLDTLKTKVNEISNALAIQKAQFDLLAMKAKAFRSRK